MKFLKCILFFAVLLAAFSMLSTAPVFAEDDIIGYGIVTGSCVNVRGEPSLSGPIWDKLYKGHRVNVIGTSAEWLKVSYNDNAQGWIHGDYVDVRKETTSRSGAEVDRTISKEAEIVAYAKKFLGVPYVYGGSSPSGFDCSGFTSYVYKHFGYTINRVAADQAKNGTYVEKGSLQQGDLVFFSRNGGSSVGHVGIYIGENKFIHASSPGSDVKINSLSDAYYLKNYITARKIIKE